MCLGRLCIACKLHGKLDFLISKSQKVSALKVPLLDLRAHHQPIQKELTEALERVLLSNTFILGPEVEALEREIAELIGCKHAIGVSSGTDALLVALMALELKPGDEVITPPFSFFATAGVIARLGGIPVLCDIDPVSFNLDPNNIERAITAKTRGIIPVHLYGQSADMQPIMQIAQKHALFVVEDAAQSLGAQYKDGRASGTIGDIGCFSFFPSKNLGALGDAGMVVTDRAELAERLRLLRAHGAKPKYFHKWIGGNFRLDALQAAALRVKLPHLQRWSTTRQRNSQRYRDLFQCAAVGTKTRVRLPAAVYEFSGVRFHHIYNQFVIMADERDALRSFLKEQGVETEIYYPVPFHLQECFAYLGHKTGDFPFSERAALSALALPIFPEITEAQQEYVVECVGRFYELRA
jgi:dTDP-4-amino-4,6-dideoxygalactose transaminase